MVTTRVRKIKARSNPGLSIQTQSSLGLSCISVYDFVCTQNDKPLYMVLQVFSKFKVQFTGHRLLAIHRNATVVHGKCFYWSMKERCPSLGQISRVHDLPQYTTLPREQVNRPKIERMM